jgi:hypothetical protein
MRVLFIRLNSRRIKLRKPLFLFLTGPNRAALRPWRSHLQML